MTLAALGAEFQRAWSLARSYWVNYLADLVLYTLGFLLLMAVFFVAAADHFGPNLYLSALIGYVTWKVCTGTMLKIAKTTVDESKTGTLEQLFVTGQSPGVLLIQRSLGEFLMYGARGLLLGGVLASILGVLQPIPGSVLVFFLLSAAGIFGLGFGLAGLALVYKRISGMLSLIGQMLVFFSGALAPLTSPGMKALSRALPLSWGIEAMRAVMVENVRVATLWEDGVLLGLLINTGVYLLVGSVLFRWGVRRARELGVLGQY